jgi:hypothetical protein
VDEIPSYVRRMPGVSDAAFDIARAGPSRCRSKLRSPWPTRAYDGSPSPRTAINDELPIGEKAERPGLRQAATPLYRLPELPPRPSEDEIAWLLTRPIADPLTADRAALALDTAVGRETAST